MLYGSRAPKQHASLVNEFPFTCDLMAVGSSALEQDVKFVM
jgi:hypothetical protein